MANYIDLCFRSLPLLLKGAQMTGAVFLGSAFLSFAMGLVLGIFSSNRFNLSFFSTMIKGVTFVYRAVPFYVHLLIVYFVLPDLLGVNFEPFAASVIALGMCSSGYMAQIVRAGIDSIPIAQWEAAFTLGYSNFQSLRYIILPQMMRHMLPTFNNELDSLFKSTAIVSSIGLLELTRAGMNLVSREMDPVPIYLLVAFFYLCFSIVLNIMTRLLTRKIGIYVKN